MGRVNTKNLMNIPSELPKKLRIKFKRCLLNEGSDTPDGSTEESTIIGAMQPCTLDDPGGAVDAGAYPKVASMTLWYDKYRPYEAWVAVEAFSTDTGPIELFTYWNNSVNARHVAANKKSNLCTIPRIKFRKFPDQQFAAGIRRLRVFRKIKVRDLFPRFDVNAEKLSTTITDADGPTEQVFFHCGVTRSDGQPLENEIIRFSFTVGCSAILYRRDEITTPAS